MGIAFAAQPAARTHSGTKSDTKTPVGNFRHPICPGTKNGAITASSKNEDFRVFLDKRQDLQTETRDTHIRRKPGDTAPRAIPSAQIRFCLASSIFFHPDFTVGAGIPPVLSHRQMNMTQGLAGYTAGWDLPRNAVHYPTLKIVTVLSPGQ
jgi:hypothetical protein